MKNYLPAMVVFLFWPAAFLPAQGKISEDDRFIKTMQLFVDSEGLGKVILPSYTCSHRKEVCGRVLPGVNLQEVLNRRPDFAMDLHNFKRAHRGASYSYRGNSGKNNHYSLHVVGYGSEIASVHVDVRLAKGRWGNIEHDVRDVAANWGKTYILQIKNSHTSEKQLLRNFAKWWKSYQTAYPEFAERQMPAETASLLEQLRQTHRPAASNADFPLN